MPLSSDNAIVAGVAACLGAALTGFFAWLRARTTATTSPPADLTTALAAYQTALNTSTAAFTASLLTMNADLRDEVETQRAATERCEGRERALCQKIGSLGRWLEAQVAAGRLEVGERGEAILRALHEDVEEAQKQIEEGAA